MDKYYELKIQNVNKGNKVHYMKIFPCNILRVAISYFISYHEFFKCIIKDYSCPK